MVPNNKPGSPIVDKMDDLKKNYKNIGIKFIKGYSNISDEFIKKFAEENLMPDKRVSTQQNFFTDLINKYNIMSNLMK